MIIARTWVVAAVAAVAFAGLAHAQESLDPKSRQELKKRFTSRRNHMAF